MRTITLSGLRGGVGTSSITAMLADALHAIGRRVLAVDLSSTNMLRLHFNVPYKDLHGWSQTVYAGEWRHQTYEVAGGLCVMPFGGATVAGTARMSGIGGAEAFWSDVLPLLEPHFDWVLFDCGPGTSPEARSLRHHAKLDLLVTMPDVAAWVLLQQRGIEAPTWLLINCHDPSRALSRDIVLDMHCRCGTIVVPVSIHRDESVHEALAHKTTVLRHMADAAASEDARSLALWCVAEGAKA